LPRLPGRTSTRDATTPARPLGEGEQPGSIAVTGGWTEEDFRRNLEAARASAPRRKPKTCKDCGLHEKQLGHPLWCTDCWLRRQPVEGNRCAICRKEFKQRPNLDHDHVSNKVRGLLCDKCNYELLGAAAAAGDPSSEGVVKLLLLAIHYLRNPPMSGRWRPGQAIHDEPPF
jgi:hypothetical protein